MAIHLECERCTACCRWPGEVRLTDDEIAQLAAFKGLTEPEFIERFTRLRADRRGLALKEQPDGACICLAGRDCSVQAVKPLQCREFPNRWMNSLWGKVPVEIIQKNYPMLMNCAAVKGFIQTEQSGSK